MSEQEEDVMKEPYIFNIQKFSLHDGPGIRTTVFFKGCPLRCKWCHNPESQNFEPELMVDSVQLMENDPKQIADHGKPAVLVGQQYAVKELINILKKDVLFYDQSGGGVTLSGGEVMAQDMEYVVALLKELKREGISVTIDTCGQAPRENFIKVLPYTDLFLYDLKMMDHKKHMEYTGVSNQQILENLTFLSEQGAGIELRLIMVEDVNMSQADICLLGQWLRDSGIRAEGITLLPYHDFGRNKYEKLSRKCTQIFAKPSELALEQVKSQLEKMGFSVRFQG